MTTTTSSSSLAASSSLVSSAHGGATALSAPMLKRLQRELQMLECDPPPGVSAWPVDDSLVHFQAQLQGPEGTPYAKGTFTLEIQLSDRYPFEPPSVRFITPIYHPNIDSGGRICLDTLKMPPNGAWTPSINLSTLLTTILLLVSEPNPDDGLMIDITDEYRHRRDDFIRKARESTLQHAMKSTVAAFTSAAAPAGSGGVSSSVAATKRPRNDNLTTDDVDAKTAHTDGGGGGGGGGGNGDSNNNNNNNNTTATVGDDTMQQSSPAQTTAAATTTDQPLAKKKRRHAPKRRTRGAVSDSDSDDDDDDDDEDD